MSTYKRIKQWLNCEVVLEVEDPIIREWYYWIDVDFKTTYYVSKEGLVFRVVYSFVYCYLCLLTYSFALVYNFITDIILFFIDCMFYMGNEPLLFTIDASNILINNFILTFLLDIVLIKMHKVNFIRQSRIQSFNIISKLYDQMVWQSHKSIVLLNIFRTSFALKFIVFNLLNYIKMVFSPVE